jgi:hypothetical protein
VSRELLFLAIVALILVEGHAPEVDLVELLDLPQARARA